MIKNYCIIYEKEERTTVYASNPCRPYFETTFNELTVPAMNIVEAINYVINKLEIHCQDIKEIFEL